MQKIFDNQGDWAATHAAEKWCKEQSVSVGAMQRDSPRGLKRGDYSIAKWRNLSKEDAILLDGTMTGDPRNGPITIELKDE